MHPHGTGEGRPHYGSAVSHVRVFPKHGSFTPHLLELEWDVVGGSPSDTARIACELARASMQGQTALLGDIERVDRL
jgi:hypothetical protein